jgi:hypothetical protein
MVDYSKGLIYSIVCHVTGRTYIGSTLDLEVRMGGHVAPSNTCTSALVLASGQWTESVLELYPCTSKYELERRERMHILACRDTLGELSVNDNLPASTPAERKAQVTRYTAEHRAENTARRAKHRAEHRDEQKAYQVKYYAEHRAERNTYQAKFNAEHRAERNTARRAANRFSLRCDNLNRIEV